MSRSSPRRIWELRAGRALLLAFVLAGAGGPAVGQVLAAFTIENGAISQPLTGGPGNPARGRLIVRDTGRVTCLICHSFPIPEEPDQGEIGPSLRGVGLRYTPGQLRLRLVDPKTINPATIMPSYYRVADLNMVLSQYRGQPIYSAEQIEDVVAYLASLRE